MEEVLDISDAEVIAPVIAQPISDEATLRVNLLTEFMRKYHDLIAYVRATPIQQHWFQNSLTYLDTGLLWAKEAMAYGPLITPEPIAAAEEPVDIVEEVVETVIEETEDAA